jgi:hypothetical protein
VRASAVTAGSSTVAITADPSASFLTAALHIIAVGATLRSIDSLTAIFRIRERGGPSSLNCKHFVDLFFRSPRYVEFTLPCLHPHLATHFQITVDPVHSVIAFLSTIDFNIPIEAKLIAIAFTAFLIVFRRCPSRAGASATAPTAPRELRVLQRIVELKEEILHKLDFVRINGPLENRRALCSDDVTRRCEHVTLKAAHNLTDPCECFLFHERSLSVDALRVERSLELGEQAKHGNEKRMSAVP